MAEISQIAPMSPGTPLETVPLTSRGTSLSESEQLGQTDAVRRLQALLQGDDTQPEDQYSDSLSDIVTNSPLPDDNRS